LASPVGSAITFEQMVGRAARGPAVGGVEEAVIWQLDNLLAVHGWPSSYSRYLASLWERRTPR
jgi:DNA repair protein RadD